MRTGTEPTRVSSIVLAAGASKRMGEVKQLLSLGDVTLLGRVLKAVWSSRIDECIVVLGFAAETIEKQLKLRDTRVVVNHAYSEGMSSSLRVGLANVHPQAEAALVVLADQPFVKVATIDQLIEEYKTTRPQVAIPVYRGFRGNPVLLDRSVFAEAMALQGDIGCRAIFGSGTKTILKVPVDDGGILIDADNPEEFERIRRAWDADSNDPDALLERKSVEDRQNEPSEDVIPAGPELIIVGREPAALALIKLAKQLQFTTTIVDPLADVREFPEADRIVNVLNLPSRQISEQ